MDTLAHTTKDLGVERQYILRVPARLRTGTTCHVPPVPGIRQPVAKFGPLLAEKKNSVSLDTHSVITLVISQENALVHLKWSHFRILSLTHCQLNFESQLMYCHLLIESRQQMNNPQDGYIRLQVWAFTQGFALVDESRRGEQKGLNCIYRHDNMRDTRKTERVDPKRAWTASLSING